MMPAPRIYISLLLGYIFFLPLFSAAQGEEAREIIDWHRFTLQQVELKSGTISNGVERTETFKGSYKGGVYTLCSSDGKKKYFSQSHPLNRDDFHAQLNANLPGSESTNPVYYSDYSVEQVFMWLYTLNQEQDAPPSGNLHLGRLTQVGKDNHNNTTERIELLESFNQRYVPVKSTSKFLLQEIKKSLPELIKASDNLKNINSAQHDILDDASLRMLLLSASVDSLPVFDSNIVKSLLIKLDATDSYLQQLDATNKGLKNTIERNVKNLKNYFPRYASFRQKLVELQQQLHEKNILPIEKVSLQFERGHLERIQVWVQNQWGKLEIYENIYAIGFTSISNYRNFYGTRLFLRRKPSIDSRSIFLSDVLDNYDNLLDLFTRDYSPADTTINEQKPSEGFLQLKRVRAVHLFDSRIFTDLQGINANEPNGLIQVEIARRFNIHSNRSQIKGTRTDWTGLSYFRLTGAITKIEDKNRELPIRNQNIEVNNLIVSPSYVSNIDLRRFENASLGIDLNLLLFDYPDAKFTAYLDAGARYAHIPMSDSLLREGSNGAIKAPQPNPISGHTVTFSLPQVTFEFFSERRVGFNLTYARLHTRALTNNRFKQVMSYEKSDLTNPVIERWARNSNMTELNLRIETSREGNGQLFFRNRFFWQKGDINTTFVQTQLGYQYNIVFRR